MMMKHFATPGHIRTYFRTKYGKTGMDNNALLNEFEAEVDNIAGIEKMKSIVSLADWRTANVNLCRVMKRKLRLLASSFLRVFPKRAQLMKFTRRKLDASS